MKLKFYVLLLISLSFLQVSAQDPITIGGACSTTEALGSYVYNGIVNGKNSYRLTITSGEAACNDFTTEATCGAATIAVDYDITWSGSRWEWTYVETSLYCQWFAPAGLCIPGFRLSNPNPKSKKAITLFATSSEDTTLPPCNGWVAESGGCVPVITGCEALSVIQNTFSNDIKLYPNPTNGSITINFGNKNESLTVRLISIIGQVIWTKNFQNSSSLQFEIVQPTGFYFVEITGENEEKALFKVLKE
ncbi:MAG: T9SS type A sorting domain-containing protein [Flavobacteriaceae bacterium]|nr:T9SS type A sorting domain-containing protein [Flavobacteriaceae bacterium]